MASTSRPVISDGHVCVVGVQWGDEGKGKVVDVLGQTVDAIVRYQGGANAGHTVKIGEEEFIFHLVPSGILQKDKLCVIGNGVVLDLRALIDELDGLRARGLDHEPNLWISDRAHLVLPYHRIADRHQETEGQGNRIGTTLRGIGPCYTDKAARRGIRLADLLDFPRFEILLRNNIERFNRDLESREDEPLDAEAILEEYSGYAERIRDRACNVSDLLAELDGKGHRILFEGAQGALLDIDLGTYPYVTSSSTSFLGLGPGSGFSPRRVGTVLGITKAYATRVGEGPFPTELDDEVGDRLRQAGGEYGATTGRPRRCGWLDLFALRYTVRFGDVDALVVTKLDVLDGFESLQLCVGYEGVGSVSDPSCGFPAHLDTEVRPRLHELPGWTSRTADCRRFEDLPEPAREYLQYVADTVDCPIAMLSVGKERSQIIHLDPWLKPRSRVEGRRRGK